MKTLGDLLVKPLEAAIKADVNDATPEPDQDCKVGHSGDSAKDCAETIADEKQPKPSE